MKKRIDFTFGQEDDERFIFRFYPRGSHVHGFDDSCPKSWDKVYKVYYAWAIIWQMRDDENSQWKTYGTFLAGFDECSVLGEVPEILKSLKIGEEITIRPLGDGVEWHIKHCTGRESINLPPYFHFEVWERVSNQGYRFDLSEKEVTEFTCYIEQVTSYMLEHSEPI